MKYIILFSALFFSISAVAQTCNASILLQTPGSWKARPQCSASVLSVADLAREKKIVATLHSMIQSKYTPMGLQANYLCSYGRAEPNMPGNFFAYQISSYIFYCDGSIMVKEKIRDYYTAFFINANLFENKIL